ncbi:Putative zinc metalloprotease [Caulifigura coniformis]|uniref:Zinc metalloprotease n=1 Tax=Caulifigura coniformis TaxID=2527983 RepID=A0A517SJL7_9PLAN|nr:RIP metalloprotease RseP [Caulifigura coniformis]QDT56318.1 Putative zinc metalloprotease [Caulifigura coniformis]
MDNLLAAIPYLDRITNIATVAIGLGLVIFFHELGHFAVAKWCNVMVERFSIGFGPVLWRKKWGETEYALSAIPFGGYVKMLGQDDIDPGQMADEQVAADPRSYTAKSVPQRMAIISAGVTMNIITGILFFAFAFHSGIEALDREVGFVKVGMPAWEHGVREGDVITSMNGRKVEEFQDILRQTALSRGNIEIVGKHADGTAYHETFSPDRSGIRRRIGTGYQYSLRVAPVRDPEKTPVTIPGSPASQAAFLPGDLIVEVDGVPVQNFMALKDVLAAKRKDTLKFTVERKEKDQSDKTSRVELTVAPEPFRQIGLRMSIGRITDLRIKSPAVTAGLELNDLITHVDGREVGRDLDPMRLPEYFEERAGQEVKVTITKEVKGSEPQSREVTLVPEKAIAWSGPRDEKDPLEIQAIGAAVDVLPNIVQINPEGPAANLGIQPGDSIVSLEIPADPDQKGSEPRQMSVAEVGWPYAYSVIQDTPRLKKLTLNVRSSGSTDPRPVVVELKDSTEWFQASTRGLLLGAMVRELKAESFVDAMEMSFRHTRNSVLDIYLTLRNLVSGDLSIRSLHGPIGIAKAASVVAEEGFADFLMFLGLISINLAVINFLPIPVLDGGHMVFLLWEAIARRKPSERVLVTATYIGFAFVVGLMFTVIWVDLFADKK